MPDLEIEKLNIAIKKAVEIGIFPKYVDQETYLKHRDGMKEVLKAVEQYKNKTVDFRNNQGSVAGMSAMSAMLDQEVNKLSETVIRNLNSLRFDPKNNSSERKIIIKECFSLLCQILACNSAREDVEKVKGKG